MDLIPRGESRSHWTTEQKQTIAAQSLAPGASLTNIARLHDISTGQLYTLPALKWCLSRWRPWISRRGGRGLIEIGLPDGTTVRIDAGIDPRALRRVLAALRG